MDLPISETVCVSVPSPVGQIKAAAEATVPRDVALTRGTIVREVPLRPLGVDQALQYLPPATTTDKFAVRASAAVDPGDPTRGFVAVEAAAPIGRSDIPLRITLLLDVSESMESVPMRVLPALQDEVPPDDKTSRLDLAKAVIDELVVRMPARGELALVAFQANEARVLLQPTPAERRERIREAVARARPGDAYGSRTPLETVYDLAGTSFDPCADHRVLLITDDNAHLHGKEKKTFSTVAEWAAKGLELWTLSVGLLGEDSPQLDALTEAGGGVHVYADTRSEAVEPLVAALRSAGAVVREPSIEVGFGPRVTSWRRVGTEGGPSTGPDTWALPVTLEGGWREARLYEVTLAPPPPEPTPDPTAPAPASAPPAPADPAAEPAPPTPPEPWATVTWAVGSPVPGDWTRGEVVPVAPVALVDAQPFLRGRVYAIRVAEATSAPSPDWAALDALGKELVREPGGARELHAWAHALSARP